MDGDSFSKALRVADLEIAESEKLLAEFFRLKSDIRRLNERIAEIEKQTSEEAIARDTSAGS